ncbi:MAG: hypothetical protein J0I06_17135, partial [Planctomycetes bacterium]|nr:hypothetical protein [Planctomycetota bacterium]
MLKFGCLPGVPVPAVRTARPLVESAGEPLAAGRVAAARWRHGHHSGIGRVGRAKVAWVVGDAGRVGIAHAPPGARPAPAADALAYTVELLRSPTPTGGARAWWACPACGRRCAL